MGVISIKLQNGFVGIAFLRVSARLFSCGFVSYLYSVFVGEHLWRTASKQIILYTIFNLFF